ncbi:MAG: hypothetical protein PSN37_03605 [Alphaproteobacteria bacterium]|nr:hypothetical protein [Alphaproteobacteria bacterium]
MVEICVSMCLRVAWCAFCIAFVSHELVDVQNLWIEGALLK